MKLWCIALVICLPIALSTQAKEKYHQFTDAQGRSIEAVIVRYNETENTVTVHPKGRSAMTVPINAFSDEDQAHIIKWSHNQAFLDERILRLDISPIEKFDRYNIRKDDHGEERGFYHYYSVTFENKSTVDLEDLTLEYVIFYQQEKHTGIEGWNKVDLEGTLYRRGSINIPHKSAKKLVTDSIRLVEYRTDNPAKTAVVDLDSKMDGIILKISMTTQDNEKLTREIIYPDKLKKKWTTKTRKVL